MEWQPIETAPKDGTEILGAWYYGGWSYQPMIWRNGWVKKFDAMSLLNPSHWMPLPPPPEAQ